MRRRAVPLVELPECACTCHQHDEPDLHAVCSSRECAADLHERMRQNGFLQQMSQAVSSRDPQTIARVRQTYREEYGRLTVTTHSRSRQPVPA